MYEFLRKELSVIDNELNDLRKKEDSYLHDLYEQFPKIYKLDCLLFPLYEELKLLDPVTNREHHVEKLKQILVYEKEKEQILKNHTQKLKFMN